MHSKRVVSSRVRSLPWICTYSVRQIEIILNQRCDYNRTTAAKETIIMFHTSTSTCSQLVESNQFIRFSIHSEHCYYSIMTDMSVWEGYKYNTTADEEDNILPSSGGGWWWFCRWQSSGFMIIMRLIVLIGIIEYYDGQIHTKSGLKGLVWIFVFNFCYVTYVRSHNKSILPLSMQYSRNCEECANKNMEMKFNRKVVHRNGYGRMDVWPRVSPFW